MLKDGNFHASLKQQFRDAFPTNCLVDYYFMKGFFHLGIVELALFGTNGNNR